MIPYSEETLKEAFYIPLKLRYQQPTVVALHLRRGKTFTHE